VIKTASRSTYLLPFFMPSLHSHTVPLTAEQAELLRKALLERGFTFAEKQYTLFAASKEKLNVAVYEKGPKALIQGKGLEDFITFVLEPEVLGEARLGYEEVHDPEQFEPHFGVDESGKGDLFGPLVIAGVYVDGDLARHLRDAGVRDSKGIGSDKKIRELAEVIRKSGAPSELIVIGPEKYNQLYKTIGNLNRLLAWGHARIIENLCAQVPACPRALSDKFADARVLQKALLENGRKIQLDQRTKAESDYAVAAASILAREGFINWLDKNGNELGITLAKGVSPKVKSAAAEVIAMYGESMLPKVAKMHFKTAAEVLVSASKE
jgi:ribonuclease HIII